MTCFFLYVYRNRLLLFLWFLQQELASAISVHSLVGMRESIPLDLGHTPWTIAVPGPLRGKHSFDLDLDRPHHTRHVVHLILILSMKLVGKGHHQHVLNNDLELLYVPSRAHDLHGRHMTSKQADIRDALDQVLGQLHSLSGPIDLVRLGLGHAIPNGPPLEMSISGHLPSSIHQGLLEVG